MDSKLVIWSRRGEIELEHYDSRVRTVPSRIHAALLWSEDGDVLFDDLGSSSGSVLVGETKIPEPFITLYATPEIGVHRVAIRQKYAGSRNK